MTALCQSLGSGTPASGAPAGFFAFHFAWAPLVRLFRRLYFQGKAWLVRPPGRYADVAAPGGQVIAQVVATMDDIHRSSSRIGEIVGTIDRVALRINILALNATVEAAHADEQGNGFAVVATWVRSRVQCSAAAARDIKPLIDSSVQRMQRGTRAAEQAGEITQQIVYADHVNDARLREVATATQEQNDCIAPERCSCGIRPLDAAEPGAGGADVRHFARQPRAGWSADGQRGQTQARLKPRMSGRP